MLKKLIVLVLLSGISALYGQQNDLSKSNLNGNIKSVRTIQYRAIQKAKKIELGAVHPMMNFKIYYNKNGNDSIRCQFRYKAGIHQLSDSTHYKYNGQMKSEQLNYNNKGEQHSYSNYNYDQNTKLLMVNHFGMNDSIYQKWSFDFNNKEQYKVTEISMRDTLTFTTHLYKLNGDRIESKYYRDGQFNYSKKFNYEDDRNVKSWVYLSDDVAATYSCSYEFDDNENWIKKIETLNEKAVYVTERTIVYHDE